MTLVNPFLPSGRLRVISSGQIGADIGALRAAADFGLPTGGYMPQGFRTLAGPRPEYHDLYGCVETLSGSWTERTGLNVQWADATLRFAVDFNSPGEIATKRYIDRYHKRYQDVDLSGCFDFTDGGYALWVDYTADVLAQWLVKERVRVLNVAGNAKPAAVEHATYAVLTATFEKLYP